MKLCVFLAIQVTLCSICYAQKPLTKQRNVINNLYSVMFAYNQYISKYNVDLAYVNKLGDLLNNYRYQLQAVLDEQLFNTRESEIRTDLQNLFINNNEVWCTANFNDGVNDARALGFAELHYCLIEVREDFNAFRNNFTYSKDKVDLEKLRTDNFLKQCMRIYNQDSDLTYHNQCVQTTRDNFVSFVKAYKINAHSGTRVNDIVTSMGRCADVALRVIENILNKNYKAINDCLAASINPVTRNVIIPAINTMNISISILQVEKEMKRAIASLSTDADRSLEAAADIKAFLDNGVDLRYPYGNLDKSFKFLEEIELYQNAFEKTWRILPKGVKGIDNCISILGNRLYRMTIKVRESVIWCTINGNKESPLNTLTSTIDLENNLKSRDLTEGLISVINCFSDKKNVLKPETAACCVTGGDQRYRKYVAQIDDQAEIYRQRFSDLSDDYFVCQDKYLPQIVTSQQEHRKTYEACISKEVNYTFYMQF